MTKLENRDPPVSIPVAHRSGSLAPSPTGPHHDPRSGGEVRPGNFVPIKNGGEDK
jgi:hypothetical protein